MGCVKTLGAIRHIRVTVEGTQTDPIAVPGAVYIYGNDRVVHKVLGMKVTYAFHTALAHAYYVVTTLTGL